MHMDTIQVAMRCARKDPFQASMAAPACVADYLRVPRLRRIRGRGSGSPIASGSPGPWRLDLV